MREYMSTAEFNSNSPKPLLFITPSFREYERRGSLKDILCLYRCAVDQSIRCRKIEVPAEVSPLKALCWSWRLRKKLEDSKIVIGPMYKLWPICFLLPAKGCAILVGDSPVLNRLLTDRFDFQTCISLIKWFALEFHFRNHLKLTASMNDYLWYRSRGGDNPPVALLKPFPTACSWFQTNRGEHRSNWKSDILIINPNSRGVDLCIEFLEYYQGAGRADAPRITIISSDKKLERFVKNLSWITFTRYVSDLDAEIRNSVLTLLCDVGGGGFCNRAMHVRLLSRKLVCTIDSLRGTNLEMDPDILICANARELYTTVEDQLGLCNSNGIREYPSAIANNIDSHIRQSYKCFVNDFARGAI